MGAAGADMEAECHRHRAIIMKPSEEEVATRDIRITGMHVLETQCGNRTLFEKHLKSTDVKSASR